MGNRAVITTRENFENNGIGIYLHWNGGRDSIEAFLKYCELRKFRAPDDDYGWARLCQVIANFMGGDGLSVGIDTVNNLDCDNYDNGTYIIEGWNIVGREYFDGDEQDEYILEDMLKAIDEAQPKEQQLGDYLTAEEVPVSELNVGDEIYVRRWNNEIKRVKVLGFGDGRIVNGVDTKDLPYADICGNGVVEGRENPNNYIQDKVVRRVG